MFQVVNPDLAKRLARNEYVVDPKAVADAMVRRRGLFSEAARLLPVLEPAKVDHPSRGSQ